MRFGISVVLICFTGCVPIADPTNNQSAREICFESIANDLGDNPQQQAESSVLIEAAISEMEFAVEHGTPRSVANQQVIDLCATSERSWCLVCEIAIVNETYDNYVPTPGAIGVCRRATFPDDNIEGIRDLMQLLKDEGYTKFDFISGFVEVDLCNDTCISNDNIDEFFTFNVCISGCSVCIIALADEVW